MNHEITERLQDLGRSSRVSAAISAVGLTVLFGSFGVATWRLHGASEQLTRLRLDISDLDRQKQDRIQELAETEANVSAAIQAKTTELDGKTKELESVKAQLESLRSAAVNSKDPSLVAHAKAVPPPAKPAAVPTGPPLDQVAHVQMSVSPNGKSSGDKTFFNVRFWLDLPPERMPEVLKVQYYFDNPTFVPKLWDSYDSKNGFQLKYTGWGCIDTVQVTLVSRDGKTDSLPFKMCDAWARSGLKPVTPTW
jgi:hypothetical protein